MDDVTPAAGRELVVCTYRKIAIYNANSLTLLAERDAPFGFAQPSDPDELRELAWLHSAPRRVQVAEMNASSPGKEIVVTTVHGHLLVLASDLSTLAEHTEAGLVDLLVGPAPQMKIAGTDFDKPIFAMSTRGHIISMEMDSTLSGSDQMAWLSAASPLAFGAMRDMATIPWQGGNKVAALFTDHSPSAKSIRIYDPWSLDLITSFGNVDDLVPPPPPGGGDTEPVDVPKPVGATDPTMTVATDGAGGQCFVVAHRGRLIVWDDTGVENYVSLKHVEAFAPARGVTCVAAGDVDENTPGDEIIVSTLGGKVVWFTLAELFSSSLYFNVTRTAGVETATGEFFDHRTNSALTATWGMALDPMREEIHAIDQAGTWWKITKANADTGRPEYVRQLAGEGVLTQVPQVANLVYAGPGSSNMQQFAGGSEHTYFNVEEDNSTTPPSREIHSTPYVPGSLPAQSGVNSWVNPLQSAAPRTGLLLDDFWVCPRGGASRVLPSGQSRAVWWSWSDPLGGFAPTTTDYYPNLVQSVGYDLDAPGGPRVLNLWNSTGAKQPNNVPPPLASPAGAEFGFGLRTDSAVQPAVYDMQAAAFGNVLPGVNDPQVFVSSSGGRVMMLQVDGNGVLRIIDDTEDYGYGGMALATYDLDNDGNDELLFAPAYTQVREFGNHAETRLWVLDHAGGSPTPKNSGFSELSPTPESRGFAIGDPGSFLKHFPGYGACGIAVANLDADPQNRPEIIVTTTNGELVVFRWNPSASPPLTPLHYEKRLS